MDVLYPSLPKDPNGNYKLEETGSGSPWSDSSSASTLVLDGVSPFTAEGTFCSGVYSYVV